MKRFLRKTGFFIAIIISLLVILTILNKIYLKHFNPFKLGENVSVLILGDSHSKYAFNDGVLGNACNLSEDADSYFYSYQKLKQVVRANPHIDTVLLSFSGHNIVKSIEDRWLLSSSHLKNRMTLYFPMLDMEDYLLLARLKPIDMAIGLFDQALFPLYALEGTRKYGGYEDLNYNILKEEIERHEKEEAERKEPFTESAIEKDYLLKIADFCRSNKITLFLVNTPVYKTIQDEQDDLYRFYEKYFKSIPFYDFSRIEMQDSYFVDLVHLSPSGASYFSEWFRKENILDIDKAKSLNVLVN